MATRRKLLALEFYPETSAPANETIKFAGVWEGITMRSSVIKTEVRDTIMNILLALTVSLHLDTLCPRADGVLTHGNNCKHIYDEFTVMLFIKIHYFFSRLVTSQISQPSEGCNENSMLLF